MQTVISFFVSLGLLGGTALASGTTNPGDMLYPVKRAVEKVHTAITVSEQAKAELSARHAEKRLSELSEVKADVGADSTKIELEAQAKADAEAEVNHALSTLSIVKTKLDAKQNTRAAASIAANIARLQAKAELELGVSQGRDEGQNNDDKDKSESEDSSKETPQVKGEYDAKNKGKADERGGGNSAYVEELKE